MRLWWGIADVLMSRQILRRSLSSFVQLQGQVVQLHFDYTKTICISSFASDSLIPYGDVLASTIPIRYLSTRFLTWIKATLLTWSYTMAARLKNITWKIGIRPSVRLSTIVQVAAAAGYSWDVIDCSYSYSLSWVTWMTASFRMLLWNSSCGMPHNQAII